MKYFTLLFFMLISLNAKIIEVDQLFNKSLISVKEKNIEIKKSFYGKTAIDESKIVDITTRFDGFIERLYANKSFMYIDKTKPLFSVYSDEIVSVQEELLLAKKIKNQKSIYKSAYNKLASLDLHVKTLNQIKSSKKVIQDIAVYSPIDGYLIQKNINDKAFIKKGNLIMRIADFSQLWFITKVYQQDLEFISKNMKALLHVDGVNLPIEARVDYIYPSVDKKEQTVDVRIILDNKDLNLFPNMFAKVELFKTQRKMLTLPKSAVLTKGDKHYVFKPIDEKEFEPIEITAKRINSQVFEIIDGLNKGDKVIDKVLFMLDSDALTNGLYSSDDEDW